MLIHLKVAIVIESNSVSWTACIKNGVEANGTECYTKKHSEKTVSILAGTWMWYLKNICDISLLFILLLFAERKNLMIITMQELLAQYSLLLPWLRCFVCWRGLVNPVHMTLIRHIFIAQSHSGKLVELDYSLTKSWRKPLKDLKIVRNLCMAGMEPFMQVSLAMVHK